MPHYCSQPLCLASPQIGASSAPLGGWLLAPSLFPLFTGAGSTFHSIPQLVLHCYSLFMLFRFVGGGGIQSAQGMCCIMFPGGWGEGELHMVSVIPLCILQAYASRFGTGHQGEMM
jgi:hypothetical protein